MDSPRKLLHLAYVPIRWGDMDAVNHVNNTIYFRYMEQARIEWFEQIGYGVGSRHDESVVIVNASCSFLVPLTYPGEAEIKVFAGALGRSSLETHYEIGKRGEDIRYAEGAAKVVWIKSATGKSWPLPEPIRALFA